MRGNFGFWGLDKVFLLGVTPWSETKQNIPVGRPLVISWADGGCCCRLVSAGEAEASSAGEQLAEEYPAGTDRTDESGEESKVWLLFRLSVGIGTTASAMPDKTHASAATDAEACSRLFSNSSGVR